MSQASAKAVGKARIAPADFLGYGLVAAAVWLGWEILKAPVADRAPPAYAVRLAPGSPEVLRRAAEAELLAKRSDNAAALAAESLRRAPFNARALRVRGLAEAQLGNETLADEMLTLAGNWSLRDDPAHAWLVQSRLRRGDYASAFAHADTLARRREDLYPSLFQLFETALQQDPRAFPVMASLLGKAPPWRNAFVNHLHQNAASAPILGGLAVALERSDAPFSAGELQQLYGNWITARRFEGVRQLRRELRRPSLDSAIQNGGFNDPLEDQIYPFGWELGTGPGIASAVVADDMERENPALRLEYDGLANGVFVRQLLLLPPGESLLRGRWRTETPQGGEAFGWELRCAESGAKVRPAVGAPTAPGPDWSSFELRFSVPPEGCTAQWLELSARPRDRRSPVASWFDELEMRTIPPTVARSMD